MNRLIYLIISVLLFAISYVTLSFFSTIPTSSGLPFVSGYVDSYLLSVANIVRVLGLLIGMGGAICLVFTITGRFGVRIILSLVVVFITLLIIMGLPLFDQIWGYLQEIPFPSFGLSGFVSPFATNFTDVAQNNLSTLG